LHNGLGSGLIDYWLNTMAQKPFTEKSRMNVNFGFLFAGNTSTGADWNSNQARPRVHGRLRRYCTTSIRD